MKRILLILALSSLSWAGISVGTACTPAAATSCTLLATPTFGDLLVSMAYRSNSATAPTTAATWTVVKSTTGNVNSIKVGWKYAIGNETTCGTWANATQTFCQVYKGGWITGSAVGAAFGGTTSGTTGSSTTLSYPTFTLVNSPSGNSWVGCAGGGASATNVDQTPAGTEATTLRSGTSITNIAFFDTNAAVTAWAAHTLTLSPTGAWASACFEIIGSPAITAIDPYLVHNVDALMTNEGCTGSCAVTVPVPASLTGNYLNVHFTWQWAVTRPTVSNVYCNSDTGHATWTWTQAATASGVADTTDTYDYYSLNATAGCTSVTVVPTLAYVNMAVRYREFAQIANAVPDNAVGLYDTTFDEYPTPGAVTPTQTGDLIYQDCSSATMGGATGGGAASRIYHSGGITSFLDFPTGDLSSEAFIETGSGALTIRPYWVGSTGNHYVCTVVALKVSPGAGTQLPAGVQIVSITNINPGGGSTTATFDMPVFKTGDSIVIVADGNEVAQAVQWTTFTGSINNNFTFFQPHDASAGYPNIALDCNAIAGNDLISQTGAPATVNVNFYIMEVRGLDNSSHTACNDATAGTPTALATATTTATNMPSITPSTSGGIVIATSELGTGTPTTLNNPSGGVFQVATYPGQTDLSWLGLGNMYGYKINTSTAVQNWGWTNGSTSTSWEAIAIALKVAATTSGQFARQQ